MPFFVDQAAGRVVFLTLPPEPGSPLKVIDGETAGRCKLTDGQPVTPQQAAALLEGSIGLFRSLLTDAERDALDAADVGSIQAASARPVTNRPELEGVTYMGTHPRYPNQVESITLSFSAVGLFTRVYDEPWLEVPWSRIRSIVADSRESLESRVTATRVLLFGAIGLLARKSTVISYLVVTDQDGEFIFAVPKLNSVELQAWSQPFRSRLASTAPPPLPAPSAPPPSGPAPVFEGADQVAARLERLDMLRARNVITDAEHAAQRAQIIAEL